MKSYQKTESGSYMVDGMAIPNSKGNRHYQQMLTEIEAGNAEILPYVTPANSPEQIRDGDLQSIVLDLDGDGVRVIQCRPAKFAQDESNMRNAIEKMEREITPERLWFMNDNTAHMVTVADLQIAIISGQDQAADIWDQFFLAIQE